MALPEPAPDAPLRVSTATVSIEAQLVVLLAGLAGRPARPGPPPGGREPAGVTGPVLALGKDRPCD